jgi:hypothetical protein
MAIMQDGGFADAGKEACERGRPAGRPEKKEGHGEIDAVAFYIWRPR